MQAVFENCGATAASLWCGEQAELHQARLLNRRQFEDESLPMLATDIRSVVDLT